MIFHTPILAMLLVSLLSSMAMLWAARFAVEVVRKWDIDSGHGRQIRLEKRTYLVVTLIKLVLLMELASLILFVINADQMAVMFTGAMCAVGTLNINAYGMPALLLKMAVFFGAAIWLIVNHADEKARDYPLTRTKYALLAGLAPVVIAAGLVQFLYFYNLRADVITSCCSKLFTPEAAGIDATLSSLDPKLALYGLYLGLAALLALVVLARRSAKGPLLYGAASPAFFALAIVAIISVISSYVYEQPHHHCPFCILKPEYGYIGFALYLPLFLGTAFGMAAGVLALHPLPLSLRGELPALIQSHVNLSALLFLFFGAVALTIVLRSNLVLFG